MIRLAWNRYRRAIAITCASIVHRLCVDALYQDEAEALSVLVWCAQAHADDEAASDRARRAQA